MNAQTFHDIQQVLAKLDKALSSHRYGPDRYGMVPPEAIDTAIEDVENAAATLRALRDESQTAHYSTKLFPNR